jgi:E3 ubiquitin-protein ligase Topors
MRNSFPKRIKQVVLQFMEEEGDRCPICLLEYQNQSYITECFHSFCYSCIHRWIHITPFCPLCKANANSLVHSVISETDFQVHYVTKSISSPVFRRRRVHWGRVSEEERKWIEQLEMRKRVYIEKKRAKHVGVSFSSKIPDLSPDYFRRYPEKIQLLTGWIRRELNAIIPNAPVEMIRDYVQTLMQTHHIQSQVARDLLSQYLFEDTDLFVHELVCFSRSSLSMTDYDRYTQYQ